MTIVDMKVPPDGLEPEDRAHKIRDRLRNAIMERRLGPGTKLPESDVGALFDVSRTIARSALQMLAFEGLVRIERNRGAFVAHPSPEEARQVFSSRRIVEAGVVAEIGQMIEPGDIGALTEHLAVERHHIAQRGPHARRSEIIASGEFHRMLAAITRNAILIRFMDELIARSSLVIALYGRTGTSSCGHDEHVQIVDALRRGDMERANELMLHHIAHLEADLDLETPAASTLRTALQL